MRVLPERTATITDFDQVVLAVPVDNFRELNPDDRVFWRGFAGSREPAVGRDAVVPSLDGAIASCRAWRRASMRLDEPLPMVIDYKPLKSRYQNDQRIGSALEWVGQETSFEHRSDEELKATAYELLRSQIPGAKDPGKRGLFTNRSTGIRRTMSGTC